MNVEAERHADLDDGERVAAVDEILMTLAGVATALELTWPMRTLKYWMIPIPFWTEAR